MLNSHNYYTSRVYVLTGLRTGKYDQVMRLWSPKPQSGIDSVLDYIAYCYVLLPRLPCYSIPRLNYHTRSFSHLGVSCLLPSISSYHTRPFSHLGISRLRPSIPTLLSTSLPSSGSYCVNLYPCSLLFFASRETPIKVARS